MNSSALNPSRLYRSYSITPRRDRERERGCQRQEFKFEEKQQDRKGKETQMNAPWRGYWPRRVVSRLFLDDEISGGIALTFVGKFVSDRRCELRRTSQSESVAE